MRIAAPHLRVMRGGSFERPTMGIDYMIHYDCEPKRALSVAGLMARLKGRERAERIIQLYRDEGDARPPREMAFEMVRSAADGSEEREVIVVQDLLDAAAELEPWEHFCVGCPANRIGVPFGCIGTINYPLSLQGERWLLDQLPDHRHPLIFTLLQSAVRERGFSGMSGAGLRTQAGVFFEADEAPERDLESIRLDGNQLFEMLFLAGPIAPAYGSLLLQFFGGIPQDLEADVMMQLADPPAEAWIEQHAPFLLRHEHGDDATVTALKEFVWALYLAFRLRVAVLLDV